MAIQRVGGYVFSCAGCGLVYPAARSFGRARQDELNHHRPLEKGTCSCRMIGEHQHHSVECEPSLRAPAVAG